MNSADTETILGQLEDLAAALSPHKIICSCGWIFGAMDRGTALAWADRHRLECASFGAVVIARVAA